MAAPPRAALLLLLAPALALRDSSAQAALREGDVTLRSNSSAAGLSARPAVHTFFAFDSALGMVKRRAMVRSSLEHLRRHFMDGRQGREAVAWRFFSDEELPDGDFVRQPAENRRPKNERTETFWIERWLFDLQWGLRHYDFKWLVRADDDGVLCPRNFARLTEGLRTLRPAARTRLRAKERVEKPHMDAWTEEALSHLHADRPESVFVLSQTCTEGAPRNEPVWPCRPSAREQYERQVRMFEVQTVTGEEGRREYDFEGDWEENWNMMTPQFAADLLAKADSGGGACRPKRLETLDNYLRRLLKGKCSERRWPGRELSVVNIGHYDKAGGDPGFSDWGHSVWNVVTNEEYRKYTTLKEFHLSCAVNEIVWFHHVDAKNLDDVTVPQPLQWLDELPQQY